MTESTPANIKIYFTDFFDVDIADLQKYGAFNVSLINDLPLFIDPFLLFNSKKPEYRKLHEDMIRYLRFLRRKAEEGAIDRGLIDAWFTFREVKQNWLGFSKTGNSGSGLGTDFAKALHANLHTIFRSFGEETVTKGSHLEKLTLIRGGVGRDNISDFTTTLIKCYLLEYTQTFARTHVRADLRASRVVPKVSFNYETECWEQREFELPIHDGDFVILTPKDMLTRDDTWINRPDLLHNFEEFTEALPNATLRAMVNNYFRQQLGEKQTKEEILQAKIQTIQRHPEIIEYYIRSKEEHGEQAQSASSLKVRATEVFFIEQVKALATELEAHSGFYLLGDSYLEARLRAEFLKDVIENKDGYRFFWRDGQPIRKEEDLHILYRLTWFGTPADVNREVNNGRGPVDFVVSQGAADKSVVEFKLASNSKLKQNLQNQVAIYQKASDAKHALKVIFYFTEEELEKVRHIFRELNLADSEDVILIDARRDNKPSASTA